MAAVHGGETDTDDLAIVHDGVAIAREVHIMDSFLQQTLGAVGRGIAIDAALVFPLPEPQRVSMTNLLVPEPIDVVFVVRGAVTATATMPAWRGGRNGYADTVIELPHGGAETIHPGDTIQITGVDD